MRILPHVRSVSHAAIECPPPLHGLAKMWSLPGMIVPRATVVVPSYSIANRDPVSIDHWLSALRIVQVSSDRLPHPEFGHRSSSSVSLTTTGIGSAPDHGVPSTQAWLGRCAVVSAATAAARANMRGFIGTPPGGPR